MDDKKHKKVTWECGNCKKNHVSYSNSRWDMQVCDCGMSAYDLEEHYSRTIGSVKIIKIEEID